MSELVVDAALANKLRAVDGDVILKDEAGEVLGRFRTDAEDYTTPDALDDGLTPEERARALDPNAKTYTTAEVLAYLRSLK